MGLGSLALVEDPTTFILFSFLWKFLCGVGAGINSTASFAIIATHYKHEREKTIGMMEASSGVGLLIGPLAGGILYDYGGFIMPFFCFCKNSVHLSSIILTLYDLALVYFLLYPLIAVTLNKIAIMERQFYEDAEEAHTRIDLDRFDQEGNVI